MKETAVASSERGFGGGWGRGHRESLDEDENGLVCKRQMLGMLWSWSRKKNKHTGVEGGRGEGRLGWVASSAKTITGVIEAFPM